MWHGYQNEAAKVHQIQAAINIWSVLIKADDVSRQNIEFSVPHSRVAAFIHMNGFHRINGDSWSFAGRLIGNWGGGKTFLAWENVF